MKNKFIITFVILLISLPYRTEATKDPPKWASIIVPGLGDFLNDKPKLGTFWMSTTILFALVHKSSMDRYFGAKSDYTTAKDFGLFNIFGLSPYGYSLQLKDLTNSGLTYYKFSSVRKEYRESVNQLNITGSFLIFWWTMNAIFAQTNPELLFEEKDKSSFHFSITPSRFASSTLENMETLYKMEFVLRF